MAEVNLETVSNPLVLQCFKIHDALRELHVFPGELVHHTLKPYYEHFVIVVSVNVRYVTVSTKNATYTRKIVKSATVLRSC